MNRCIQLAKNGLGITYPNPMVGCVIVVDDVVIGEGWHRKAGEAHAEVNAINAVKDKKLLKKATIYVSLEPCSHYGKTPPCSNLIVHSGIKKVVIGSIDTNSLVSGKGVAYLKNNSCNVIVGILEQACKALNKRFFTFHEKKRPFIILKWAETKDGFIDKIRTQDSDNIPNWISNSYSQQLVHKMRAVEEAILVGTNTVLNDNPSLTARKWFGKNPVRVVIDKKLKTEISSNLLDGSIKTILFTEKNQKNTDNIFYERIDFDKNVPKQICDVLYKYEIQSVIIEGGAFTLQSFIATNLWDEAYVFKGEVVFKEGLKAPKLKRKPVEIRSIIKDTLCIYKNI